MYKNYFTISQFKCFNLKIKKKSDPDPHQIIHFPPQCIQAIGVFYKNTILWQSIPSVVIYSPAAGITGESHPIWS